MAVGESGPDLDGKAGHKVSFTSLNQNEQIVALIDPGQLSIELRGVKTAVAAPGRVDRAGDFRSARGQGRGRAGQSGTGHGPINIHGREAPNETITAPPPTRRPATLTIRFTAGRPGPLSIIP